MNNIYHVFYLLHILPSPPSPFKIRSFLLSDVKDGTIIPKTNGFCKDSFSFSSIVDCLCQYQVNVV